MRKPPHSQTRTRDDRPVSRVAPPCETSGYESPPSIATVSHPRPHLERCCNGRTGPWGANDPTRASRAQPQQRRHLMKRLAVVTLATAACALAASIIVSAQAPSAGARAPTGTLHINTKTLLLTGPTTPPAARDR